MASAWCWPCRRHEWFAGARFIGLALVGAAAILFAAIQPDSAGYAGVYFVMAIGGIRLGRDAAIIVCGGTVVGDRRRRLLAHENPAFDRRAAVQRPPVVPGHAADPPARATGATRPSGCSGAARVARGARPSRPSSAERGRVARELHDVLAHSLSALSLQLEGTRLLAAQERRRPVGDRRPGARAPPRRRAG